jgi:hypothetical protein
MATNKSAAALDFVEIPGYADECRREARIRAEAWLGVWAPSAEIAGISVRPLTPRMLILLEHVKSAFVVPFRFDSPRELAVEAARFVWLVSTSYEAPRGFLHRALIRWRRRRFIARIRGGSGVVEGIHTYLEEAFYDAPRAAVDTEKPKTPSYAPWPAHVLDDLCAAGYAWSLDDFLDTPFAMVWQMHSLARHRLYPDEPLVNPSSAYAARFIERLNQTAAKLKTVAESAAQISPKAVS